MIPITPVSRYNAMVNLRQGTISREIFSSREIYEEELEKVFTRAWLFVGHESQIPNPGDFFTSRMGGESVSLQEDGKVAGCTYTYPLYQNKSCSVEKKVSFHANGFFKDCTLPEDKTVGKAVCKADAPVSYRANGTIATCTLATPAEQAPGKVLPAGTIVNIDEKHGITVKEAAPTAPAKPAAPAQPATPSPVKK